MSKNYRVVAKVDPETAVFIDEGIRPLVVALNQWRETETRMSCEGHPGHKTFHFPYIEFDCPKNIVSTLKERIRGTSWGIFSNRVKGISGIGAWMLRPYFNRRSRASIKELSEIIKNKDFDPGDIYSRVDTHIFNYRLKNKKKVLTHVNSNG